MTSPSSDELAVRHNVPKVPPNTALGPDPDLAWVDKLVRLLSWLIPGEMRVFPTAELNTAKEWVAGSARRHCRSSVPIPQASGRLPTGPVPRSGDRPQPVRLC